MIEALKENMKDEAREQAVLARRTGEVDMGENGFGAYNLMGERANTLTNECFDLASICLAELVSEESFTKPGLYCSFVEQLAEKREDEERWLTQEMRVKLRALRPTLLMGQNCVSHPLHEWMIMEMALHMRKQILVCICVHTCMCAAGIIGVQLKAKHDLRNMRRIAKGLDEVEEVRDAGSERSARPLATPQPLLTADRLPQRSLPPKFKCVCQGEESEDDEILNKTDYEEWQDRTPTAARQAMKHMRETYLVAPGESEPRNIMPKGRKMGEADEAPVVEEDDDPAIVEI